jgi:hypothetical protein
MYLEKSCEISHTRRIRQIIAQNSYCFESFREDSEKVREGRCRDMASDDLVVA